MSDVTKRRSAQGSLPKVGKNKKGEFQDCIDNTAVMEHNRNIQKNKEIQEKQLKTHDFFQETGLNGIPPPDDVFTKAVRTAGGSRLQEEADREEMPSETSPGSKKYETVGTGQASFVGKNCKGSLGKAYKERQPWSLHLSLFKNKDSLTGDIKYLDKKSKVKERLQIIEDKTEMPFRFVDDPMDDLKYDKDNKTYGMFQNHKVPKDATQSVDKAVKPKSTLPLVSFKHFYEMQNNKLEMQKQNLMKIQQLQKEKNKLRYGKGEAGTGSLRSTDIQRLKLQCEEIKSLNDKGLQRFRQQEKEFFSPKYTGPKNDELFDPKAHELVKTFQKSSPRKMKFSQQFGSKEVHYKTGYDFFKQHHSIKHERNDNWYYDRMDPTVMEKIEIMTESRNSKEFFDKLPKLGTEDSTPNNNKLFQEMKKKLLTTTNAQKVKVSLKSKLNQSITTQDQSLVKQQEMQPFLAQTLQPEKLKVQLGQGNPDGLDTQRHHRHSHAKGNVAFDLSALMKEAGPRNQGKSVKSVDHKLGSLLPKVEKAEVKAQAFAETALAQKFRNSLKGQLHTRQQQIDGYFAAQVTRQDFKSEADYRRHLVGPKHCPKVYSQDVRLSSNPNDCDVDMIMKKVMTNKIAHDQFDPIVGRKSTRKYFEGLVFQCSELAPYRKYVFPPSMAESVAANIKKKLPKEEDDKKKNEDENTEEEDMLPFHLGANVKDFERAKWLAQELNKLPYHVGGTEMKSGINEAEEALILQEAKWQQEKLNEYDKFEDRVIQVFDPLSLLSKETSRVTPSRQARIYDMQIQHNMRLMKKQSNNSIRGLPDYLTTFEYKDAAQVKKVARDILQDKYDHKGENKMLDDFVKAAHKARTVGGPLDQTTLDGYPGHAEYIKYLEKQYGYHHQRPDQKKLRAMRRAGLLPPAEGKAGSFGPSTQRSPQRSQDLSPRSGGRSHASPMQRSQVSRSPRHVPSPQKSFEVQSQRRRADTRTPDAKKHLVAAESKAVDARSRENRSGGQLSHGHIYSELDGLGGKSHQDQANQLELYQSSDENIIPQKNQKVKLEGLKLHQNPEMRSEHREIGERRSNPFLKMNGVLSEQDFVGQKGQNQFRFDKIQRSINQNTQDSSAQGAQQEELLLNTKRTDQHMQSIGMESTQLGYTNEQQSKHFEQSEQQQMDLPLQNSQDLPAHRQIILQPSLDPTSADNGMRTDRVHQDSFALHQSPMITSPSATIDAGPIHTQSVDIQPLSRVVSHDQNIVKKSPGISHAKSKIKVEYESRRQHNKSVGEDTDLMTSSEPPRKQRKRSKKKAAPTLTHRVRKIKNYVGTLTHSMSLSSSQAMNLQKYQKPRKYANDIYENGQIRTIMEDDWIQKVALRQDRSYSNLISRPTLILQQSFDESSHQKGKVGSRRDLINATKLRSSVSPQVSGGFVHSPEKLNNTMAHPARSSTKKGKEIINLPIQIQIQDGGQTLSSHKTSPHHSKSGNASPAARKSPTRYETTHLVAKSNTSFKQVTQPQNVSVTDDVARKASPTKSTLKKADTFITDGDSSIISSTKYQGSQLTGPNCKNINQKFTQFVEVLDDIKKSNQENTNHREFDKIKKLFKEDKEVKKAIVKYLEVLSSNPHKSELANTIDDYIAERKHTQGLFKANMMDPENIARMKRDNLQMTMKIPSYGKREMWMPDKYRFQAHKDKNKAPTVKFDKDGRAYYPVE